MTPAEQLRDAWLSECWKPCRELPREERAAARALMASTGVDSVMHKSTGAEPRKTPRKRRRRVDNQADQKVDPGSDSSQLSEESRGLASRIGAD